MKRYLLFKCVIPIYCFLLLALSACALVPAVDSSATPIAAATSTPTSIHTEPDELLPQTFYYLAHGQVFRMERDGKTVTQLTFEDVNVTDYDVSLADGSVAYVANNQLILIDADGSNRRVLVAGVPTPDLRGFYYPVFSPDGKMLAYYQNGINLYDLATGISNLVLEDQYRDVVNSNSAEPELPLEIYVPEKYSPDGTKLLITVGHPPDSPPTAAIYFLTNQDLVPFTAGNEFLTCCTVYGGAEWLADSSGFYAAASILDSTYRSGALWKVDAVTGAVTTLISLDSGEGTARRFNFPYKPYLAPDGQLYFFFGTYDLDSGFLHAPVLKLVRSAPDGVTDRIGLRDENFVLMDEALWAPDASFVIVSVAPMRNWNSEGGVLELYDTHGQKSAVWLAPLGYHMKWGP